MNKVWKTQMAKHIGRQHILDMRNCQDSVSAFSNLSEPIYIGVISDGCSEGVYSEVGANLTSNFLVREAVKLWEQHNSVRIIPDLLYINLIGYLENVTKAIAFSTLSEEVLFIKDNLLSTVVGFIATEDETVIFSAGDGTIIVNEQISFVDQNNRPMYPAYHLVDRSFLSQSASDLPNGFEVFFYDTTYIQRLAIGSDAWKDEEDLLSQIWEFKHPSGLQRRINQWSRIDKRFRDDVSIITLEIVEDEQCKLSSITQKSSSINQVS